MTTMNRGFDVPPADSLGMADLIAVYEFLRPHLPVANVPDSAHRIAALTDILGQVDAVILDGYGVINVGMAPVTGIEAFLQAAAVSDTAVMVLTNGAGQGAETTWRKYHDWGLPIRREQVVSSRDALEAGMASIAGNRIVGTIGTGVRPLGLAGELTMDDPDALFERAEVFAFLGSSIWDERDQARLEAAIANRGCDLLVANPDVGAPLGDGFSSEPGYWAVRAMQATGIAPYWFGKPHRPAFELALSRLESVYQRQFVRGRVAMVGDSLHTDILGAAAAGLRSVLLTDYGLFKDGGADAMIARCGIVPDWIAPVL